MAQSAPSELDARLAEIDRRLHQIQAGLVPEAETIPAAAVPAAEAEEPLPESEPAERRPSPRQGPLAALLARTGRRRSDPPVDEIAELVRMHNGLLDAVGQLARLLAQRAAGAETSARADISAAPRAALVSAGPFSDTHQVESFMLTLAALEPVREAALVGYEGTDRALIEVQLSDPTG